MTRSPSRIFLLLVGVVLAAASPQPSRKERLAALPADEREWLTEFVAPILLPEEERIFLELTEPYQFEAFKESFWERRERQGLRFPLGPGYRERYAELKQKADAEYDGSREDAGRMVLARGEPGSIRKFEACNATMGGNTFRDLEVWTFDDPASGRRATRYLFYRPTPVSPRKLWTIGVPDSDVLAPGSCRKKLEELALDCPPGRKGDPCAGANCMEACEVYWIYSEVRARQGSRAGGEMEAALATKPGEISTEGLEAQKKKWAASSDSKAKTLALTTPSAARGPVSKKEQLAALPEEERAWLTDYVAPIILPDEEKLFLELTELYQRDVFKKAFWERRERDGLQRPFGPGFEKRYEDLRPRLDSEYDGWRSDAGRMVLHYGEPDELHRVTNCDTVFWGLEIWTYQVMDGVDRRNVRHLFYRTQPGAPRRLWVRQDMPGDRSRPDPQDVQIFVPASCRKSFKELRADCHPGTDGKCAAPVCPEACDVYRAWVEISTRQGSPLSALAESSHLLGLPLISTEGLDRVRSQFAQSANPNAKPLAVSGPSSRPATEPSPGPEPKRLLSPQEIRDRIVQLEPRYRQFLELAIPLINQADLSDFLQMTPREKDRYIRDFWSRRK